MKENNIVKDKIKKIGVLTSGGDSPGMNAAIRAVVRTGIYFGLDVYGIRRGYAGMVEGDIFQMESKSVANIIQRGGTILKTARCGEFKTPEGREKAYQNIKKLGINGLVVIGGDGTFKGANAFSEEFDIPCVGLPGTIDKDIAGTEFTIGFDTAVNTAVQAIDRLRDTADSHDRLFIIEVMGRDSGFIALHSGVATGAENILIPERDTDVKEIVASLKEKRRRQKLVNIIVVAEGDQFGAAELARVIESEIPEQEARLCILGHIQRGGAPTCLDRVIASRMGFAAVECLLEGRHNVFVGIVHNNLNYTPLSQAVKGKHQMDEDWIKIVKILST